MTIRCPTCDRRLSDVARDYPHRPFCSPRCKLADLNNWLNEAYCISEPAPHTAHHTEGEGMLGLQRDA